MVVIGELLTALPQPTGVCDTLLRQGLQCTDFHTSPLDQPRSFIIHSMMTSLYLFLAPTACNDKEQDEVGCHNQKHH